MYKHTSIFSAATPLQRITTFGSAIILLASWAVPQAKSASYTYTGGDGGKFSSGFSDGTNNGIPPASSTSTILSFGGTSYTATDDISSLTISSLNFTNSGAVILASTNSNKISLGGTAPTVVLGNAMGAAGLVTINPALILATTTTFSGSGSATINGKITGSGGLTLGDSTVVAPTGVLTLTGSNSYSGVTNINRGTLSVNTLTNGMLFSSIGESSNSASNLVLNGGTLQYIGGTANTDRLFTLDAAGGALDASGTGTLNLTNSGSVLSTGSASLTLTGISTGILAAQIGDNTSGPVSLVKSGGGAWSLINAGNNYTGGTAINGGVLTFASGSLGTTGNISFGGGTLQYANENTQDLSSRILNSTSAISIDTNNNSVALGSSLGSTNTGGLIKTGLGELTLSLPNTYSGGTTVNGGVLTISSNGSIGSGGLAVNSIGDTQTSATIDFNATSGTVHTVTSLSSVISGNSSNTATIQLKTGNTLTDTQSGTTNYAGSITGVGTLDINGQGTGGNSALVNYTGSDTAAQTNVGANATLQLNNASGPTLSGPVAVATGGALTISPNGTSNEIATAAPPMVSPTAAAITLNGGTLNANGSDGAVNDPTHLATTSVSQSMGALALGGNGTLTNPSLLNLGAGTSANPFILAFADSSQTLGAGYLDVTGYTGTTNALYIGTAGHLLAPGQLGQIAYDGVYGAFSQLGNGELVLAAAPEPSGVVSSMLGAAGLAGLVFLRRRTAKAA